MKQTMTERFASSILLRSVTINYQQVKQTLWPLIQSMLSRFERQVAKRRPTLATALLDDIQPAAVNAFENVFGMSSLKWNNSSSSLMALY